MWVAVSFIFAVVGVTSICLGAKIGRRAARLPGPGVTPRWNPLTGFATMKGIGVDLAAHALFLGGLLVVLATLVVARGLAA